MARWIFYNKTLINADGVPLVDASFVNQLYFLPNTNSNILADVTNDPNQYFYSGRTVISALDNGVPVMAKYIGPDEVMVEPGDRILGNSLFDSVLAFNTTADVGYNNLNEFTHRHWIETPVKKGHIVVVKDTNGSASSSPSSGIYIVDYEEDRRIEGKSGLAIYEPHGYAVLYWNGVDQWHVISKKGVSGWG